jgi:hypothetical protein
VALVRLRKTVAFDRLLVRLLRARPDRWALKGGLALQLRLGDRARTTKDIDLSFERAGEDVLGALRDAASIHMQDWFGFEVERSTCAGLGDEPERRFHAYGMLDLWLFERIHHRCECRRPSGGAI